MDTLVVNLTLPRDLLGTLDISETQLPIRLKELIALELFREGRISSGKGAELLGISKWEFIRLLAQHHINYFTESAAELEADVVQVERLLSTRNRP